MAVAVALLLLVSSLVACTEKGDGSDTTTAVPAAASSDTPESSSPYVEDDLPELNYNGQKLGVLVWSDVEHFEFNDEIGVEKNVSDLVASKLLSRIGTVQTRLGVEIEFIPVPGNAGNLSHGTPTSRRLSVSISPSTLSRVTPFLSQRTRHPAIFTTCLTKSATT